MFEDVPSLSVLNFFSMKMDCHYSKDDVLQRKHLLIDSSAYLVEERFANVYMGWNEEKLIFNIHVNIPFTKVVFPNFKRGDSVELFIDTRNLKEKNVITKFCHYFLFFPQKIDDKWGRELTRFRSGDMHPIVDFSEIEVDVLLDRKSYFMKIIIPQNCLFGFDPKNFLELGFTYRINRFEAMAQDFSCSSDEYNVEKHPDLWASFVLKR